MNPSENETSNNPWLKFGLFAFAVSGASAITIKISERFIQLSPPGSFWNSNTQAALVFLVTLVLVMLFVGVKRLVFENEDRRVSIALAITGFVFVTAFLWSIYTHLQSMGELVETCRPTNSEGPQHVVKGDTYTAAADYQLGPNGLFASEIQLLEDASCDARRVWTDDSINVNTKRLNQSYLMALMTFLVSISALSALGAPRTESYESPNN